jgi:hypothetical protein
MNEREATELEDSGVVAFNFRALSTEEQLEVTRSEPVNVFSPTMNLAEYASAGDGLNSRFVLVDTHTGSVFSPAQVRPCALLGREGFRLPPAVDAKPVGWARARFQSIPYFIAADQAEYESLTAALQASNKHVFFRGQTTDYTVQRSSSVRRFLYGDDSVREPSLPSSASRNGFDYASAELVVQFIFGDIQFRLSDLSPPRTHWVEDEIEMVYVSNGGMAARQSARTMALAQHYGIPTYGLDVTRSARFAWWFATHSFDSKAGLYTPHEVDIDTPLHDRPVVYVLSSQHSVELDDLNLVATRPSAQHAVFVHGSWGLHENICAEDLIAIVILGAGVGVCDESLDALFPEPQVDPVYKELLALKKSLSDTSFTNVLRYVYEVRC